MPAQNAAMPSPLCSSTFPPAASHLASVSSLPVSPAKVAKVVKAHEADEDGGSGLGADGQAVGGRRPDDAEQQAPEHVDRAGAPGKSGSRPALHEPAQPVACQRSASPRQGDQQQLLHHGAHS